MQEDLRFGEREYFGETTLHPVGLGALALLAVLFLTLPRRWALFPILALACFIPSAQRLVIAGFDFDFLRIMLVAGWVRLLAHREFAMRWQGIDTLMVLWGVVRFGAYTTLHGTSAAAVYASAVLLDTLGAYFLFRNLVRDLDDVDRIARCLALLVVPVALAFAVEKSTSHNAFSLFGGVPETTDVREGRLRCQGAFDHPILAGCFFASFLPWIAALWFARGKGLAVLGVACCVTIIILSASSTPVLGLAAAILGLAFFPLRQHMRWIVAGGFFCMIGLHLVMKAPVWHLMSRIDIAGGSTGWHRAILIDETIAHFGEWALFGVEDTGHWGYYMFDVTNHYVNEAVRGGLLTLVLFVVVLALAFGRAGRLWRSNSASRARLVYSWVLGAALFVHAVNFMGVSYFGQIVVSSWLVLAALVSLTEQQRLAAARVPRPVHRRPVEPPAPALDAQQ